MKYGSLFSGAGGLDLAVEALYPGIECAWQAEVDPHASKVLAARWPGVTNLGDVTALDWATVPPVDVLCGGYPCQPFSTAGRRQGTDDDRHLWPHVADALRVLRPRLALFENVSGHLSLGFDAVLCDLAALGFDAEWGTVRASDVGAPHRRERLWIAARNTGSERLEGQGSGGATAERRGAATDTSDDGHEWGRVARLRGTGLADHVGVATDADGDGLGRITRPQTGRHPVLNAQRSDPDGRGAFCWRATPYGPAIQRWERELGRPAPAPTDDRNRLNPRLSEWMMGWPDGWVTDLATRTQALRMIGNGVCPQQAEVAYRWLLGRAA